jgi:hypothetical protein
VSVTVPGSTPATGSTPAAGTAADQPPPASTGPTSAAGSPPATRTGRSTPATMRLVAILLVLAGLVAAAASLQTFVGADRALARAEANATQLVRLQDIQTNLVRADADVTNAFLLGGLEPPDLRAGYTAATGTAVRQIAFAARAQPADGEALAALSGQVQDYTGTIELARANNRQALPVGAQYLRNASAGLRGDALPILSALISANEDRVDAELSTARTRVLFLVAALAGLAGLVIAMVWLARRTHRYLNLPMAAGAALLAVYLVVAAVVLAGLASTVSGTRDGPYTAARALSEARIAAFDAKSTESLTLVARGSGSAFEEAWQASSRTVLDDLATASVWGPAGGLDGRWQAYASAHAGIRSADDAGDWDAAVAQATAQGDESANAAFSAFDAASATALDAAGTEVSDALAGPRGPAVVLAVAGVLVGLAVAALSWWGLSRRIEEYR